jgi:two-component system chemotaxis sensor kinase CheA
MVDTLLGQQETVVKPLEGMLKGRKEFAGATILGDGSVAFILDVGGLV